MARRAAAHLATLLMLLHVAASLATRPDGWDPQVCHLGNTVPSLVVTRTRLTAMSLCHCSQSLDVCLCVCVHVACVCLRV